MARPGTDVLSMVEIFSMLSEDDRKAVSRYLRPRRLPAGAVVFEEGDRGDELFIVGEGRIRIAIRLPDGSEHEVASCSAGDFFGEMSIFENAPRSASCLMVEAGTLYSLSRDDFQEIVLRHPQAAIKLMYRMLNVTTERLRQTSGFISDMVLWGEQARKRAVTDELTGAYNRRFLEDSLDGMVEEACRTGRPLSLLMVDLDHFREINDLYGHEKGDEAIRSVVQLFRRLLGDQAVLARYGGDELVVILPGTGAREALAVASRICRESAGLDILGHLNGPVRSVTTSIGVASCPEQASDTRSLKSLADAALYRAKEGGRNRAVLAQPGGRNGGQALGKIGIPTIAAKNAVIANIIDALAERESFLVLGHHNPDEDCIAAMVAFSLLAHLFYKQPVIYLDGAVHEHFQYLLNICRYNSIRVLEEGTEPDGAFDAVVLCDTPKPSMIGLTPGIRALLDQPGLIRIEFDHHLGADSEYFGDAGYRMVTEASSSCELVGHLLLKLSARKDLLERFQITDLYSRNIVLAILTGIIGDSKMGQYLKSRREERYFRIFSGMFNEMLSRKTVKRSNFFNMAQVFGELQRLSSHEDRCFHFMMEHRRGSTSVGYVALSEADMAPLYAGCDEDTVVSVARAVADRLAEESGKVSLVVYADNPEKSDLVQFRVRRAGGYKEYDLRRLLPRLSIRNGGGHEGAIGFRLPKGEVGDLDGYVQGLVSEIEEALSAR